MHHVCPAIIHNRETFFLSPRKCECFSVVFFYDRICIARIFVTPCNGRSRVGLMFNQRKDETILITCKIVVGLMEETSFSNNCYVD